MNSRIILVDDHKIMRDGIKSLLSEEPDMEVVGEADNGREAVQLARRLGPDLVVMDISMPELNGIEATRQILSEMDGVKVLALSMHRDPRFVAGVLEAGANGYMVKDCTADELTSVIRLVAHGKTYLSPEVADLVVKGFVGRLNEDVAHPPASVLSPREREVLQLLAEGYKVKEVAERLHLGVKTVETHRRNLMEKLDIDNLVDLIRYALREGVTSLDDWLAY
ncbi:MAG: response regulator transcription factor [Deltaproteobacteria bacterium]|nr:response regulator transcription factor [Deltaproteobacteria bacterium]